MIWVPPLIRFDIFSLFIILSPMVDKSKTAIVLCISILHLALVLTSAAGSVTCVDSHGLIKIEATNCETACSCDDRSAEPTNPTVFEDLNTHEHDDCGDCTHFFLSTFVMVATGTNHFNSDTGPINTIAAQYAEFGFDLTDFKFQGFDCCDNPPLLLAQKISSLKITIVIC